MRLQKSYWKSIKIKGDKKIINEIEKIYNILLSRNFQQELFRIEGKGQKANGNILIKCPFSDHQDSNPSFSVCLTKPVWFCWGCNRKGDWIDFLIQIGDYDSFKPALEYLATQAGIKLDNSNFEKYQKEKEAKIIKLSILEFIHEHSKKMLFEKQGQETLKYLKEQRGYTEKEIEKMGIGYFPGEGIKKILLENGFESKAIEQVLPYKRSDYPVLIPDYDSIGNLACFWGRAIDSRKDKYKPVTSVPEGLKRDYLYNYHNIDSNIVVIAEGFFDVLHCVAKGFNNIVGLRGSNINDTIIENLIKKGVNVFIFALDNDDAGNNTTNQVINLIEKFQVNFFVAEMEKEPDEEIKKGLKHFENVIRNAKHYLKWKAEQVTKNGKDATDIESTKIIREVILIRSILKGYNKEIFSQSIRVGLDVSESILKELEQEYEERKEKEQIKNDLQNFGSRIFKHAKAGNLEEIRNTIDRQRKLIYEESTKKLLENYSVELLLKDLSRKPIGYFTGYSELDSMISIKPGTINVIAGRPKSGKTALMLNIMNNMIDSYSNRQFFFFSYEMLREKLAVRLINMFANHIISEKNNLYQIEKYLIKNGNGESDYNEDIERGKGQLDLLLKNGNLWLKDEAYITEDLCRIIFGLAEDNNVGVIFIDYFQKLITEKNNLEGQKALKHISNQLLQAAIRCNIPIIIGAQIERTGKYARESDDIQNDATTFLKIEDEKNHNELSLLIVNNRDGEAGKEIVLDWNKATGLIKSKNRYF